MTKRDTKKANDDAEEMFELRPAEVTLTSAPAVREDFLMTKGKGGLNDLELHGLAAKLGVDGIEAIPEVEVSKAVSDKVEAEKALHDDEEEDEDGNMKGKVPPQFQKKEDEDEDEDKDKKDKKDEELDLGKSSLVRSLAPVLLTQKSDLPPSLVKALEKSIENGEADDKDNADTEAAKAVADVMKSEVPTLVKLVQEPLLQQISKSEGRIATLEADKALAEFTEVAKSMPGDVETTAKRLVILQKSMTREDFNSFVKEQQGLQTVMQDSPMFKTIQGRGINATDSVHAVQAKADAIIVKSGKSGDQVAMAKAIETVLEKDSQLAAAYHREMQEAAAAPQID